MGLGYMGISSHFSPFFLPSPPPPPVLCHFPATCRDCSYNFYHDLMAIPRPHSHFPRVPCIFFYLSPFIHLSHFSKASLGTRGLQIRVSSSLA